jgi:hypothetical protein
LAPERARAIRVAVRIAGCASVVAIACGLLSWLSVFFVVAGTLACAVAASAAFYGAYEGFDERLRRGP